MKTYMKHGIRNATTLFCGMMLSMTALSQSHVTMGMRNITANKTTIEYDLFIVNDGSTELKLSACSYGVNFNDQITNQGHIDYRYKAKSRAGELNGLSEIAHAVARVGNINQARMTTVPSGYENAPVLTKGVPFLVGHFVLQNTAAWKPGTDPEFSFQEEQKIGLTSTLVVVYENNDHHLVALTPALKSVTTLIEKGPVLNQGLSPADQEVSQLQGETVKENLMANMHDMILYPNPVQDELRTSFGMTKAAHVVLNITDFHGRLLKQIHADVNEGQNEIQVDVSGLSAGLYTVRLSSDSEVLYRQNFVKQ